LEASGFGTKKCHGGDDLRTCSSLIEDEELGTENSSIWYNHPTNQDREKILFCLPYAGMGSAVFGGWRHAKFEAAEIVAALLPGRDGRLREDPIESAEELATQLADSIVDGPLKDRPLTLLGCSFGGLIAFELARTLRKRDLNIERLIVAACRPPHDLRVTEPVASLPDQQMVHKLRHWYGAIPAEIADNPAMLELVLPAIRADMKVYETYEYYEEEPLSCPIISIGGSNDRIVSVADLNGWRQHTDAKFSCRQFAGDHFFMKNQAAPVLRFIDRQLASP